MISIEKSVMKKMLVNAKKQGSEYIIINAYKNQQTADVSFCVENNCITDKLPLMSPAIGDFSATFIPIPSTAIKSNAVICGDDCSLTLNDDTELNVPCTEYEIPSKKSFEFVGELSWPEFCQIFKTTKTRLKKVLGIRKGLFVSLSIDENIGCIKKVKLKSFNNSIKDFNYHLDNSSEKVISDYIKNNNYESEIVKVYTMDNYFGFEIKDCFISISVSKETDPEIDKSQIGKPTVVFTPSEDILVFLNKLKSSTFINVSSNKSGITFQSPDDKLTIPIKFNNCNISFKTTKSILLQAVDILIHDKSSEAGISVDNGIVAIFYNKSNVILIGSYE